MSSRDRAVLPGAPHQPVGVEKLVQALARPDASHVQENASGQAQRGAAPPPFGEGHSAGTTVVGHVDRLRHHGGPFLRQAVAGSQRGPVRTRDLDPVDRLEQHVLADLPPPGPRGPGVEVGQHAERHPLGGGEPDDRPHGQVPAVVLQDEHVWAEPAQLPHRHLDPPQVASGELPRRLVHVPGPVRLARLGEDGMEVEFRPLGGRVEPRHHVRRGLGEPVENPERPFAHAAATAGVRSR